MKYSYKLAVTISLAAALALFVNGGGKKKSTPEKQPPAPAAAETGRTVSVDAPTNIGVLATASRGFTLLEADGRRIGRVHDLMCDLSSGYVTFLVCDLEVQGVPKGNYPVPSGYLGFNSSENAFVMDLNKLSVLKDATSISGKVEPGTFIQSENNTEQIYTFWSNAGVLPPYGQTSLFPAQLPSAYASGIRLLPGANVTFLGIQGYNVLGPDGKSIGTIVDMSYNPFTGRIYYLYVSFNGAAYANRYYPLPLNAFTLNFADKTITFDLDRKLIADDPSVGPGGWQNVGSTTWIERVHTYWIDSAPVAALRMGMRIVTYTIMSEHSLLGMEVTNFQGQTLGKIRDFVISDDGNVPYAITEAGGRWYFLPTTVITIDRRNSIGLVDISADSLKNMPGFQPGFAPDLSAKNWDVQIRNFWQTASGATVVGSAPNLIISETSAARPQDFLASSVIGYTVRGSDGEKLGDIEDLLLNMEEADAAYITLAVGGFLDFGEELYPIPVSAVNIVTGKDVVLSIDRPTLQKAPGFSSSEWEQKMEDPTYRKRLTAYWKNLTG
jgi:sporulation protein YlmC with PRC-barrel domain